MVAIDLYVNETTRHADVILPPAWALAEEHFDLFFCRTDVGAQRRALVAAGGRRAAPDERADWEILLELAERLGGGPTGMRAGRRAAPRWRERARLALDAGPRRSTCCCGTGRTATASCRGRSGSNRAASSKRAPHGIDLGPLEPGIARRVFHRGRQGAPRAPAPLAGGAGTRSARRSTTPPPRDELLLIGRRELRTNNSWMHNVPALVSGRERCVLFVHPERRGARRHRATARRRAREPRAPRRGAACSVTDEMAPGVVSLPHGWGHAASAPWQQVAGAHPGVSVNDWTDDQRRRGASSGSRS